MYTFSVKSRRPNFNGLRALGSLLLAAVVVGMLWLQYTPTATLDEYEQVPIVDVNMILEDLQDYDETMVKIYGDVVDAWYVYNRGVFILQDDNGDFFMVITYKIPPDIGERISVVIEVDLLFQASNTFGITFREVKPK